MALKKQIELKNKLSVDAYCRIDRLLYNKEYTEIIINLYNKKSDKDIYLIEGESQTFSFMPDLNLKDNFIKQAYLHIKTVDKFVGSVDC